MTRPVRHAWERSVRTWDGFFLAVMTATIMIVWVDDSAPAARYRAAGLLVAIIVSHFALARPLIAADAAGTAPAYGYVALIIVLAGAATFSVPDAASVTFALVAHCFLLLPLRHALVAVTVLNLASGALALTGPQAAGNTAGLIANTALVTAFSLAFGNWIAGIITQSQERAELIEKLEASRAEVARLSRDAGVAAERERLAGEIHDTLAQGFTSILVLLQGAEARLAADHPGRRPVELATRTARENLAEARALIGALPPAPLTAAPLVEALRRLTERFGQEADGAAAFEIDGEPRTLPPSAEVVLLRTAQEALANVRKHAAATTVLVRTSYQERLVRLTVTDDGRGFDPAAVRAEPGERFGLRGMRHRVEQVGGSVTVHSEPGHGTSLTVEIAA